MRSSRVHFALLSFSIRRSVSISVRCFSSVFRASASCILLSVALSPHLRDLGRMGSMYQICLYAGQVINYFWCHPCQCSSSPSSFLLWGHHFRHLRKRFTIEAVNVTHIAGTTADDSAADQTTQAVPARTPHTTPEVTPAPTTFQPRERRGFGI